jgi:hypothetical protein
MTEVNNDGYGKREGPRLAHFAADNYSLTGALNHIQKAPNGKNSPITCHTWEPARHSRKWADAERLCDGVVRIRRNHSLA